MQTSILAIEGKGEIHFFDSPEEAEAYMEPIDIQNGEYEIFNPQGFIILASVEKKKGVLAPERVRLTLSSRQEADYLRTSLESYLQRLKVNIQPGSSLESLVELLKRNKRF